MSHDDADDPFDALQAWLTLLPAIVLALPGGVLQDVPTTVSAGTGWTLLASLPAILVLALRRKPVAFSGSTLLLGVLVLTSYLATEAEDPFEARRSALNLAAAFALTLCGASLGAAGRRVLLRGLTLIALALIAFAGIDRGDGFAGSLGNTGHTAQAALPGAICGLAVALSTPGAWRVVGFLAGAAFGLYAGLIPVLAGLLGLGGATAALLLASSARPETARIARATLVVTLLAVAALGGRGLLTKAAPPTGEATAGAGDLGGVEFRWRTWRAASTSLLPEHLWLGTGPGQFAREYPPHRDPVERELSSHRGLEPTPVEVEHVHNDWLQGLLDLGLIGGAAWIALLVTIALGAWRALRSFTPSDVGLGAAGVASLAAALVHAPLLASPGAPALMWPLFGALLARPAGGRSRLAVYMPALAALLLLLRADPAWRFARHGLALAELAHIPTLEAGGYEAQLARDVAPHVAAALKACNDSPVALEKRDRWLDASGAVPSERVLNLRRLLEARPHRLSALVNLGILHAQRRQFIEAKVLLQHARSLAPEDRSVARNLLLLGFESYDEQLMLDAATGLLADPELDRGWLRGLAARLFLAGRPGHGQALLMLVEPELDLTTGDLAYAVGKRLDGTPADQVLADAAFACANQLWGREHQSNGRYETAVRVLRQAVQQAQGYDDLPGGDTLLRLELAAAMALAGQLEKAQAEVERAAPTSPHWIQLSDWAGQALLDAGLLR